MGRGERRQRLGTASAVAVAAALAVVALAGPGPGSGSGEPDRSVVARPFKNPATPPEQVAVARPVRLVSATTAHARAVSRTNAEDFGCALSGRGGPAAG